MAEDAGKAAAGVAFCRRGSRIGVLGGGMTLDLRRILENGALGAVAVARAPGWQRAVGPARTSRRCYRGYILLTQRRVHEHGEGKHGGDERRHHRDDRWWYAEG